MYSVSVVFWKERCIHLMHCSVLSISEITDTLNFMQFYRRSALTVMQLFTVLLIAPNHYFYFFFFRVLSRLIMWELCFMTGIFHPTLYRYGPVELSLQKGSNSRINIKIFRVQWTPVLMLKHICSTLMFWGFIRFLNVE